MDKRRSKKNSLRIMILQGVFYLRGDLRGKLRKRVGGYLEKRSASY